MRISLLQSPFLLVELPFVSFLSPTKKNNASNPKYMNLRIKHQTSWKKIVFFFPRLFLPKKHQKASLGFCPWPSPCPHRPHLGHFEVRMPRAVHSTGQHRGVLALLRKLLRQGTAATWGRFYGTGELWVSGWEVNLVGLSHDVSLHPTISRKFRWWNYGNWWNIWCYNQHSRGRNGDLPSKNWLHPILLHVLLPCSCSIFALVCLVAHQRAGSRICKPSPNTEYPQFRPPKWTHQALK